MTYINNCLNQISHACPIINPALRSCLIQDKIKLGILIDASAVIVYTKIEAG